MKAVILAGGYGTRLSEETHLIPKPMVEIGGKPIIWHIMKIYSFFGINEFVILLGYKGNIIKDYFTHYFIYQNDVTFDIANNEYIVHNKVAEPWKVTMVDTGDGTMTGGRLLRAKRYLEGGRFMLTYGDGVGDVDMNKLLAFHKEKGGVATLTSVLPEGRFGSVVADSDGSVQTFFEKPKGDKQWINAGFFVFEPEIFDYIKDGDDTILERRPLEDLSRDHMLYTYKHDGFWKAMDTLRDKVKLEELWQGEAPWKLWT
ncbi:glucose-1-phosphate cytidylyltransferase [Pseudodesulfovibrio indicus]|uniref:glucose-1-phosphate cytidylyltransferase n=1 Tax=Pseudodesulfovibrio indicus TaxID=1716143 RepID=UPI002931C5AB|nr:glucose-1-phosphate cytidylyltransferase [Pseudodesulfovibrio indicus]